ncbi:MAG: hypothetical protein JKY46_10565 [Robiginitomaculum sp.]|nr:hypothetical protein [Robiginitomaculum sp.]
MNVFKVVDASGQLYNINPNKVLHVQVINGAGLVTLENNVSINTGANMPDLENLFAQALATIK